MGMWQQGKMLEKRVGAIIFFFFLSHFPVERGIYLRDEKEGMFSLWFIIDSPWGGRG